MTLATPEGASMTVIKRLEDARDQLDAGVLYLQNKMERGLVNRASAADAITRLEKERTEVQDEIDRLLLRERMGVA